MPNSLKARLKKLKYQGVLSQEDIDRIVILPLKTGHWIKEWNIDHFEQMCSECACLTKEFFPIRYEKIGYGRVLSVGLNFVKGYIYTDYYYHCDQNKRESLAIKYCPFCGRKLNMAESEE